MTREVDRMGNIEHLQAENARLRQQVREWQAIAAKADPRPGSHHLIVLGDAVQSLRAELREAVSTELRLRVLLADAVAALGAEAGDLKEQIRQELREPSTTGGQSE